MVFAAAAMAGIGEAGGGAVEHLTQLRQSLFVQQQGQQQVVSDCHTMTDRMSLV